MAEQVINGFFWNEVVHSKKPTPPERTWERDDYLPAGLGVDISCVSQFDDHQLVIAAAKKEPLVFDIECYINYFLVAFKSPISGKVVYFERTSNLDFNLAKLRWLVNSFQLVSFNGNGYDLPILALALSGKSNSELKAASNRLISAGVQPYALLKSEKVKSLTLDHIDLIEVAPLQASLKIYGGRLDCKHLQDLPFKHDSQLSADQIAIVKNYCINDLDNTILLWSALQNQIELRFNMSSQYGLDLRSKSDAQIAEAVIAAELLKFNGEKPLRPLIPAGTAYRYKTPTWMAFNNQTLKSALSTVENAQFVINESGNVEMPAEVKDLKISIGESVYRMGIGGLHSSEQCTARHSNDECLLIDRDVVSYYPTIILNQNLFPKHLGPNFLKVYRSIVERRIAAKRAGNSVVSDSLKITINGSFGKLGSRYSILYAPDLLIQVTLSGQLALLMLIEAIEGTGIAVVSANTDGIVIKCPVSKKNDLDLIIKAWEIETSFETEETQYLALYSRDVNNYVAVKSNKVCKTKGAYSIPEDSVRKLHKNPTNPICVEAVCEFLTEAVPISETVRKCQDIRKFLTLRTVKGGAVKNGEYLGKSVRWYYRKGELGSIVYADNGNRVPRSEGAQPLQMLPNTFPNDVDFDWYEKEAFKMLTEIGVKAT